MRYSIVMRYVSSVGLWWLPLCSALCLLAVTGCKDDFPQVVNSATRRNTEIGSDASLETVMNFLNHQEESEPSGMRRTILLKLNEWIEKQRADVSWVQDPLFSRLPKRWNDWISGEGLPKLSFQAEDIFFIQEGVWARDIARAVATADRPQGYLEPWLGGLSGRIGREHATQVRLATQLFDWTVRHVQPEAPRAEPTEKSFAPAPGGKYFAMETMLLGHGDWLEQTHLFILLARQQHIPVIVLAIEEEQSAAPIPWCAAAWIGGELYLFDMQLGIPLPDQSGDGIATLREVTAHPEILRTLDLEPDNPYPVRARHLAQLTALMDATPEALSHRMRVLESRIIGKDAMVLTAAPTLIWQQLREHPGLVRQAMWTSPYEVYRLRGSHMIPEFGGYLRQGLAERNPEAIQLAESLFMEQRPYQGLNELLKGLIVMFRGEYEDGVDTRGAKYYLGEARHPDALIDNLATSEQAQRELLLYDRLFLRQFDPQTAKPLVDAAGNPQVVRAPDFDNVVAAAQLVLRQVKQQASYLLGVMELDAQRYSTAEFWLKTRTREAYPDGPWGRHAGYNLARTYEEWGVAENRPETIQQAITWYESNESGPLARGCRWRAQRLQRKLTPAPPVPVTPAPPASS